MSGDGIATAVEFSEVSHRYGSRAALRGISFKVAPGEFAVVLGPNGAGKSTTLKAISGILQPERGEVTAGSIELDGTHIEHREPGEGPGSGLGAHAALLANLAARPTGRPQQPATRNAARRPGSCGEITKCGPGPKPRARPSARAGSPPVTQKTPPRRARRPGLWVGTPDATTASRAWSAGHARRRWSSALGARWPGRSRAHPAAGARWTQSDPAARTARSSDSSSS